MEVSMITVVPNRPYVDAALHDIPTRLLAASLRRQREALLDDGAPQKDRAAFIVRAEAKLQRRGA